VSVVAAPAAGQDEARYTRYLVAGALAGAGVLAVLFAYGLTWNSSTLQDAHASALTRTLAELGFA